MEYGAYTEKERTRNKERERERDMSGREIVGLNEKNCAHGILTTAETNR